MSDKDKEFRQDPFSQLMFGSNRQERSVKQDWILGRRKAEDIEFKEDKEAKDVNSAAQQKIEQILENVDLDGLMNNLGTLMSSVGELKPLMKKAGPLLQKFLNKKD
ncbi:hypothetical protein [Cytobacillus gottheilii]|uniref:Uncharacterized protein n=1 Tax=Cytobacillus gottheilii TaxID=859144 RepID=A0ABX8FFT4_9BACI|nr:hypothetical protein [Cytobacillus gottheilii]QVY62879.1 hypothetical protein J1899_07485 [Cytobacillus gottheilii]